MRPVSVRNWIGAAALLLFAGKAAWAAPIGTISCTGAASTLSARVSFYSLATPITPASQSTGAGAGKITFQNAEIRVSLSKLNDFLAAAQSATPLSQCTLVTTAPGGVSATYTLGLVAIKSVSATASAGLLPITGAAYAVVELEYGTLSVTISGGSDDGGSAGVS